MLKKLFDKLFPYNRNMQNTAGLHENSNSDRKLSNNAQKASYSSMPEITEIVDPGIAEAIYGGHFMRKETGAEGAIEGRASAAETLDNRFWDQKCFSGIAGNCTHVTKFDVSTYFFGGSVVFQPVRCGMIAFRAHKQKGVYHGPLNMGYWAAYTITVIQNQRICWRGRSFQNESIRIPLGAGNVSRVVVTPDPPPKGARWTSKSYWALVSGRNIKSVRLL